MQKLSDLEQSPKSGGGTPKSGFGTPKSNGGTPRGGFQQEEEGEETVFCAYFSPKYNKVKPNTPLSCAEGREKLLGEGAAGTAIVAVHQGVKVALKFLTDPVPEDKIPENMEENRIMRLCAHENVARVIDEVKVPISPTIKTFNLLTLMELGKGDIFNYIVDGYYGLTHPDRVIKSALQVAKGLKAVGVAGFVHRDIKPENIIMSMDEKKVFIIDFGIATTVNKQSSGNKGTDGYRDPAGESAFRKAQDFTWTAASDVYSFGVLLVTMALEQNGLYSEDDGRANLRQAVKKASYLLPKDLNPTLAWIIHWSTQFDPASRPSFDAIIEALTAASAKPGDKLGAELTLNNTGPETTLAKFLAKYKKRAVRRQMLGKDKVSVAPSLSKM